MLNYLELDPDIQNSDKRQKLFINENAFKNIVSKMSAIYLSLRVAKGRRLVFSLS